MKKILILMLTASCSHFETSTMYFADTAGTYKCEPVVASRDFNNLEQTTSMDMKEMEKYTGYSDCSFTDKTENYAILECKKPMPYKRISANLMAPCHKFLADNKVQVVR